MMMHVQECVHVCACVCLSTGDAAMREHCLSEHGDAAQCGDAAGHPTAVKPAVSAAQQ